MSLPNKNSSHTRAPDFFHGGEDTQFIVHQHIMFGGVALLDVIKFLLLVHINQHAPGDGIGQSRTTDLERLENDVAVRENDRRTPLLDVVNYLDGVREKTLSKGIVDEKIRNAQQIWGARMFDPVRLQSAEVIRIAQFGPQLLENPPIFLRSLCADFAGEVALQIRCHSVVINQRVVYVEQEGDASRRVIDFVHFPVRPSAVPLIAETSRVCYAKMQPAGKKPAITVQPSRLHYPSPSLARFRSPIDASSKLSLVAPISCFNCARLVALAIGAVTVGRAISHASVTCAAVE